MRYIMMTLDIAGAGCYALLCAAEQSEAQVWNHAWEPGPANIAFCRKFRRQWSAVWAWIVSPS